MNQKPDSLERTKYHEWLEKFKAHISTNSLIYDVGKSRKYDYADMFKNYKYFTLDRNKEVKPDIVVDLENMYATATMEMCDAVICNGVVEQCENPYNLFDTVFEMLKAEGYALIGTVLTGFPVYDNDRVRFTVMGITNLMKKYGKILDNEIICREGIKDPTYMYLIVKKEGTQDVFNCGN